MKKAWKKIEDLIAKNARHRKGFHLGEVRPQFILGQMLEELKELWDDPNDPNEIADLLGILIHYSIKKGWTMEKIEKCLLDKLDLRFTVDE